LFSRLAAQFNDFAKPLIKEMNWGMDLQIELTLQNDSVYIYDIANLHHTDASKNSNFDDFTYYPVSLSEEFVEKIKTKGVELGIDTSYKDSIVKLQAVEPGTKALWSAIHGYIGGNWIHFVNTLLYSIESGSLDLTGPMMQRPDTKWKPENPSEAYKRTKKWDYYIPVKHKEAVNEYYAKKENNELGNLEYLSDEYIELMLETKDKQYEKMKYYDRRNAAKIDLVKLLLGANYLGETQIFYIRSMVLKSVVNYSKQQLPAVIIFDNFNAAVAMSLNSKGYYIEKIVFSDSDIVTKDDLVSREKMIREIVYNINEVNKEMFREKLQKYYE
jgi:hypothetical protein